ncbi:hypothetical protein [Sulfitobacter dubius]|uniref:hypothetical protein n=1 Tax=Sulfitobacter dubius TaxID=218673 RepID=UPI0022AEB75A|nr:hypothetical protein [Sulfitobacter dubius]MCZ4366653.1 hypothetical protein [Sulfitobacter dubius]
MPRDNVSEFQPRANVARQANLFDALDEVLGRKEFASGQLTNMEILGALELLKIKIISEGQE